MGITTTYKCDRCGKKEEGRAPTPPRADSFYLIRLYLTEFTANMQYFPGPADQRGYAVWCRACCIAAGLKMPLTDSERGQARAPGGKVSFETLVRAVVEQCFEEKEEGE